MNPLAWIIILAVVGPVIGSVIGILKLPSFGYICNMLCFAAGVMRSWLKVYRNTD